MRRLSAREVLRQPETWVVVSPGVKATASRQGGVSTTVQQAATAMATKPPRLLQQGPNSFLPRHELH